MLVIWSSVSLKYYLQYKILVLKNLLVTLRSKSRAESESQLRSKQRLLRSKRRLLRSKRRLLRSKRRLLRSKRRLLRSKQRLLRPKRRLSSVLKKQKSLTCYAACYLSRDLGLKQRYKFWSLVLLPQRLDYPVIQVLVITLVKNC